MVEETVPLRCNQQIGANIWLMEFRSAPLASHAKPGQFLMVHLGKRTRDPLLRRPFSIHGIRDGDKVMILYKVVGAGTSLLSAMKEHDTLSVTGPLGNGFALPRSNERVLLVGGGMGLAPLFFLAQVLEKLQKNAVTVSLGFSTSREAVRIQQLKDLGVNLSLATEDGSLGIKGVVTDLLDQHLGSKGTRKPVIYACGPSPMLRKVAQKATAFNLRSYVSLEGYMACGLGICLGCAVKAAHGQGNPYHYVCQDGPVFPAEIIDWKAL